MGRAELGLHHSSIPSALPGGVCTRWAATKGFKVRVLSSFPRVFLTQGHHTQLLSGIRYGVPGPCRPLRGLANDVVRGTVVSWHFNTPGAHAPGYDLSPPSGARKQRGPWGGRAWGNTPGAHAPGYDLSPPSGARKQRGPWGGRAWGNTPGAHAPGYDLSPPSGARKQCGPWDGRAWANTPGAHAPGYDLSPPSGARKQRGPWDGRAQHTRGSRPWLRLVAPFGGSQTMWSVGRSCLGQHTRGSRPWLRPVAPFGGSQTMWSVGRSCLGQHTRGSRPWLRPVAPFLRKVAELVTPDGNLDLVRLTAVK
jgi:hypothetical protein